MTHQTRSGMRKIAFIFAFLLDLDHGIPDQKPFDLAQDLPRTTRDRPFSQ